MQAEQRPALSALFRVEQFQAQINIGYYKQNLLELGKENIDCIT